MPIALTCRTCGRDYEMPDDRAMWPCAGCSTMNAPPKAEGEALDKLQRALRLRTRGEFQLAEQSYNAVLVEYDDEHEALWGRVLCHYGVEFVVDEKTQRRYPLVHIPRKTLMQESADFQQACNLAPEEIRRQYEEDAAYVDDAQAEIRALAEKCPAYDVFICHKTTQLDSNAKTEDYSWAYGLYHSLDKQGYRVFFAPEELAGVAGANYEAGIYHALYTSRVMLVICSDPAYLNSTWVQSEWQRYLEMMSSEQDDTPRKLVPLLYGDMSAGRLPTAFRRRKLQAITMSNFGADAALLNVLEETCGPRGLPEPEAAEDDEFSVEEVSGGCRITGYKGDAGDLVVPEKIRGMDVVAIASGAFEDHDDLTSVILPMSVETIGEKAFKGCSRLGSVILPVELREIGNMAFNGCRSLTAVQLPETVTHIGHYAFFGCSALADMQLPEGITEIGTGVFHGCSQLERVDIPESVTEIQRTAFGSCHALQSLTLSRNIQKIARDAFGDCRSLTLRVYEDTPAHRYAMDRRLRFEVIREDAPETPAPKRPKENPDAYRIVAEKCRGCTLCVPVCPEGCISGDVRKPHSIDASLCTGCGACGEACMFGAVAAPVRKAEAAKPAPVQKAAPEKPKPTAPKSMPKTAPGTKITTIDLGSVPKAAPVQEKPAPVKPGPAAVAPAMSAQVTKPAVPEPAKARSASPAIHFTTRELKDGISIKGYTGPGGEVHIPAFIDGKPVVSINEGTFENCKALKRVVIPEGVKTIGVNVFSGCSGLERVEIPNSVTRISGQAFKDCTQLTEVHLPKGIKKISSAAFESSGLTSVVIPDGVETIARDTFANCSKLTSISIPASVTTIENDSISSNDRNPFVGCSSLKSINVQAGNRAFCVRDNVLFTTGGTLLCYPMALMATDYAIPEDVTAVGAQAFYGCENLKSVTVPAGVKTFGISAFGHSYKLTLRVYRDSPAHRNAIGNKLPYVLIDEEAAKASAPAKARSASPAIHFTTRELKNGVSITGYTGPGGEVRIPAVIDGKPVVNITKGTFENCKTLKRVVIPEGVRKIGMEVFSGCSCLESVEIPESVTDIGFRAFEDCAQLTEVHLPKRLKKIPCGAFRRSGLTSVVIPDGVETIESGAFENCSKLTSVSIPASLVTVESTVSTANNGNPFERCSSLKSINVQAGNREFYVRDNVLFTTGGTLLCYPMALMATDYAIPEGVTAVGTEAFYGCENLKSVTVPVSVNKFGFMAFGYGRELTLRVYRDSPAHRTAVEKKLRYDLIDEEAAKASAPAKVPAAPASHFETAEVSGGLAIKKYTGSGGEVVIPAVINGKPVVEIGEDAFVQNKTLRSVVIPEGVKKIGAWAFDECSALESASIPASVTEMGDNPFCRTKVLQRITVAEGNPAFCIRSKVLYSRSGKLISYPCGLPDTECAIPNGVSVIGRSAFNGCKALRRVFLPDTLTEIEGMAFRATGLIFVNLPARVQKLGNNPFSNCPGLRGVTVAEGNEAFYERDGVLFSREGALVCYAAGRSDSEYTIPSGVRTIANNAFQGNGSIMRVRIPDSVTDVGDSAFCECKSLTQIDVPESVKNLGYGCFEDCSNLTKVTLHEGLQEIHTDAFRNCEMPILDIPYSVKKVYTETFRGFKGLLRVYENSISHKVAVQKGLWHDVLRDVPAEAMTKAVASMSKDEFVAAIDKLIAGESGASEQETKLISKIADAVNAQDFKTSPVPLGVEIVSCVSEERELVIPGKVGDKAVRGIGVNAFAGNRNITSIELPEGIAYIREGAFSGCTALKEINIPASVKVIGDSAFKGCTALKLPLKVKLRFMGSKLFG